MAVAIVGGEAQELDLRGLKCPMPALRTAKVLRRLPAGGEIVVRCTDPLATIDIPHLVTQTGDEMLEMTRAETEIIFRIRKQRPSAP